MGTMGIIHRSSFSKREAAFFLAYFEKQWYDRRK
jgi:hypothetical protein